MADLFDQLKGVNPADPPAAEPEPVEPKPEPAAKDGKGDGEGRSLDNVRGELLRKITDHEAKIEGMFSQLSNQMSQQAKSSQTAPVTPSNVDANDLNTYSVAQLEGLQNTTDWSKVSEGERRTFDNILSQRRIDETLNSKLAVFTEQQAIDTERVRFGQIAVDRYPDLRDKKSEFAREVNARIEAIPDTQISSNPRVALDIANDVAIDKGVTPQRRRTVSGKPAPTRSAPSQDTNVSKRSDAEHEQIASQLSHALPRDKDGKPQKFDMDRIRKKEADVSDRIIAILPSREGDLNE